MDQEKDDPYVKPPPPRVPKFKVFCISIHLTFCILCLPGMLLGQNGFNVLGFYANFALFIFHCIDLYIRRRKVMWLERSYTYLQTLKRIANTPTFQYNKETNTTIFTWLAAERPKELK